MSALAGERIGFIGLGLMGLPMALNLERAGARLTVTTRSPERRDQVAALGLGVAETPAAVAAAADIVVLSVADTAAVETVLLGDDGVIDGLAPGTLVIDMGTTEISCTRRFAAAVAQVEGRWMDAPVSGGTEAAEQGALTIMAGGNETDFDRARRLFSVLGRRATLMGPVGSGQIAKAANQIIVGLTIEAVAEALTFARRAGVAPDRLIDALTGGFADSRILHLHGRRMAEDNFDPGAKATTQHKDLRQALEFSGQSLGLDLPGTQLALKLYERLIAAGGGGLDHAAVIKVIDRP